MCIVLAPAAVLLRRVHPGGRGMPAMERLLEEAVEAARNVDVGRIRGLRLVIPRRAALDLQFDQQCANGGQAVLIPRPSSFARQPTGDQWPTMMLADGRAAPSAHRPKPETGAQPYARQEVDQWCM